MNSSSRVLHLSLKHGADAQCGVASSGATEASASAEDGGRVRESLRESLKFVGDIRHPLAAIRPQSARPKAQSASPTPRNSVCFESESVF